jgi:hypothetical protein
MKNQFLKEYSAILLPAEILIHGYNLAILLFIILHRGRLESAETLIALHLAGGLSYILFQVNRNRINHPLLQALTIWLPLLFIFAFYYETGLLNRFIISDFQDDILKIIDLSLFGFAPYLHFRQVLPGEFWAQFFHLAYFSYYLALAIPLTMIYFSERKSNLLLSPPQFWKGAAKTKEMLFVLLFTLFLCYFLFILLPAKGPLEYRAMLFPRPEGMVTLMNLLYQFGSLDGAAIPSSHVAATLVVTIYTFKFLPTLRYYMLGLLIALSLSTVYNAYHYGIDVIAGLLAGWLFFRLGEAIYHKWSAAENL